LFRFERPILKIERFVDETSCRQHNQEQNHPFPAESKLDDCLTRNRFYW
jgi:hypothetical protein